ncbi:unnamed protein product [Symbiodinium natans]|uniref:Uncharacterized protein n=1 Tax=Symbiodinium natans TaxID=878477 RepID=A0A812QMA2_9DINO|nr:unnamed protein product [Symbiodinium natans]
MPWLPYRSSQWAIGAEQQCFTSKSGLGERLPPLTAKAQVLLPTSASLTQARDRVPEQRMRTPAGQSNLTAPDQITARIADQCKELHCAQPSQDTQMVRHIG